MKKEKETNKQLKKAFNLSECTNLDYDLYNYIESNLYADNITIEKEGKIIVFDWKFSPQISGTNHQNNTYKAMKIEEKVQQIKKQLTNKNK
jgi:hypothetical protein